MVWLSDRLLQDFKNILTKWKSRQVTNGTACKNCMASVGHSYDKSKISSSIRIHSIYMIYVSYHNCVRLHSNQFCIIAQQFELFFQSVLKLSNKHNSNNDFNSRAIIQNWFKCKRTHTYVKRINVTNSYWKFNFWGVITCDLLKRYIYLLAVLFICWRDFHAVRIFLKSWSKRSNHSILSFKCNYERGFKKYRPQQYKTSN